MKTQKITFSNESGNLLSALLDIPDGDIKATALFAHCFTCNKNSKASYYISRTLADNGIAVLRFDFTGLGESEGDFSDTNFITNISDIQAAATFLEEKKMPVSLLIGHSLGGAAILSAASDIANVKAVVTIAAPSNPEHVLKLLKSKIEEIEQTGEAEVVLDGRSFKIKKHFLDALEEVNMTEKIKNLNQALLIMHSATDRIVGIENAEKIYITARHPKSFVALPNADHLLTNSGIAIYVAGVINAWAKYYLD